MIHPLKKHILFMTVILSFCLASALGQQTEKRIEEEKRRSLDQETAKTTVEDDRLIFDYGGWLNFRYDDFYEHDNDATTPDLYNWRRAADLRLWFRVSLLPDPKNPFKHRHSFYFRLKNAYIDREYTDVTGGGDYEGPSVDYAYLTLDFEPCQIEMGRNYYSVGRGIAYSNVHDGMGISGDIQDWQLKGILTHTLTHEDNTDTSVPGYDKGSDRYFFGAEARYSLEDDHDLYGFILVQRDFSDERPEDPANDYTYDSEYFGMGAEGNIFSNTDYWFELIHQNGQSRIAGTQEKRDVDAWAVDLGAACKLEMPSSPTLSFEYAYGTGDSSRISVTNTISGNTSKKDTNFLYFGYLDTGYALAPELSNIHLYRLGVECTPFERCRFFKNLSLGVNFYRYYKDKSGGGISDAEATEASNDIGSEIDLSLAWQIFSDLKLDVEYGYFMPGDAYAAAADDVEEYFSISTTFRF